MKHTFRHIASNKALSEEKSKFAGEFNEFAGEFSFFTKSEKKKTAEIRGEGNELVCGPFF